ncbi:MAG TPA: hypothetical protein VFT70_01185 [Nocardioides sp.]|nr:hypothetical protein [Nocardioides sp.]
MRARLVTAAAVATATTLPAFVLLGATAAYAGKDDGGSNKGDIKISTVGGPADNSNEAHVGCSFDLQWYGFERSTSTVSFAPQGGSSKGLQIAVASGPTSVELGDPKSGSDLNTIRTYTLRFTGADPHDQQGYHVEVTVDTERSDGKKGDGKKKVFWSKCDRADVPSTDPGTGDDGTTDPGTGDDGTTDPGTGDDGTTDPGTGGGNGTDPTDPTEPFNWDWQYANPTCDALTVDYPSNVPAGQANDANVRFQTAQGPMTLNFHNNSGTWSGTHVFDFKTHPQWPAGLTTYHVVWAQVGGTNYHWNGDVSCAPVPVVEPDAPFSWDWKYADPTCTALTAAYPSNIPENQASDANIRFESNVGEFTLNFHNNDGTWSGNHVFDYLSHPRWPAGVTSFHVVWTQVGGTNYHWQGDVSCVLEDGVAKAATAVQGFRTGSLTVGRGSSVATDSVVVGGSGYQDLVLQALSGSGRGTAARSAATWTTVRAISVASDGTARVTFPKLKKKGTYKFRLAVAGSGISTGDTTGTLTVRVR